MGKIAPINGRAPDGKAIRTQRLILGMLKDRVAQDQRAGRPRNDDRLMLMASYGCWFSPPPGAIGLNDSPLVNGLPAFRDWRSRGALEQDARALHVRSNVLRPPSKRAQRGTQRLGRHLQ